MRRVLGNLGLLVRGRGIAAVMMFGATALMARSLGPVEFGLVILIQTYALLMRDFLDCKLFDAVVRYGVVIHDRGDKDALRRLLKICRRVDRTTSTVATLLAMSLTSILGPSLGLDQQQVILLTGYCIAIITTGNGTAIGILRLFDRLDILGRQMTIGPAIRFVGILIAWWFDSPLVIFVAIMGFAFACEEMYLNWCGRREYHRQFGYSVIEASKIDEDSRMSEFDGLQRFLWITYWQSNLDLIPKHLSIVLAGYLLGPAEAGLLRLARQISSMLAKPAVMIRQVVLLDLTRTWQQGNETFKLLAYRTALLGGAAGMFIVLISFMFGDDFLELLVGQEFVAAAPVLTLLFLASTFDLMASSLRSAAYAVGKAGRVLTLYAIAAVVYIGLFLVLTSWTGLIGAGMASCVAALLPTIGMAILIFRSTQIVMPKATDH